MTQLPLEVYRIDMKYIRNLHKIDDRVFSVSPQIGKDERPFLGVLIVCNERKYCVPLSKPKKKHEKMHRYNGLTLRFVNMIMQIQERKRKF